MVVGLACFLPLYLRGAMGAGDLKLMGLAGSFLGVKGVLASALLTALSGGGLALVYLGFMVTSELPYAIAIFLGVFEFLLLKQFTPHYLHDFFGPLG